MRPPRSAIATAALAIGLATTVQTGRAQNYPSRNVHVIVAYAPGGTGDFVARLVAGKLAEKLGISVVVENRAGASGAIGARAVVSAAPDGHMLLLGQTAEVTINQHWIRGIGYDPDRDLMPVALAAVVPLALTVNRKAPYADLTGLLAGAKAAAGGLTFASAGTGTPGHLAGEFLKLKTGSNLTHVPYKGGAGPALNDLIAGHVDLYFPGFPAAMPHVQAGTLKVLATSSAARTAIAPDIPTVAEVIGAGDFDFTLWQGFFAPRGTPPAVVDRLNRDINAILDDAEIRQKLHAAGASVMPQTIEQFAAFAKRESAKYALIIREAGVKPE